MSSPASLDIARLVPKIAARLDGLVLETPLTRAKWLDGPDCRVWLKHENLQHTGSFKIRGALSFLLHHELQQKTPVIAASSGNHGAAVALACSRLGLTATVFVPGDAAKPKVAAIEALGATVIAAGTDCVESETAARTHAEELGGVYVSPYNDLYVAAGQGTVAVEFCRQLREDHAAEIDAVVVSVGGGGLAAGVGSYVKSVSADAKLVATSPAHSSVMAASVAAGRILDLPSLPTLSDGTAGGLEPGAITFPLCRELVDEFVEVPEAEIAKSMTDLLFEARVLCEGAAACAVAGYDRLKATLRGNVVIVLCGSNVDPAIVRRVVCPTPGGSGT